MAANALIFAMPNRANLDAGMFQIAKRLLHLGKAFVGVNHILFAHVFLRGANNKVPVDSSSSGQFILIPTPVQLMLRGGFTFPGGYFPFNKTSHLVFLQCLSHSRTQDFDRGLALVIGDFIELGFGQLDESLPGKLIVLFPDRVIANAVANLWIVGISYLMDILLVE